MSFSEFCVLEELEPGLLKKGEAEVLETTHVPYDFVVNYSNKQLVNLDIVKITAMPNRNERIEDKLQ